MSTPPDSADAAAPSRAEPTTEPGKTTRRFVRRPVIALAAAVVLVGGGAAVAAAQNPGSAPPEIEAAGRVSPATIRLPETTTTTTTAPPVSSTLPGPVAATQPQPVPPERAKTPIVKIGEIRIPKIGLVHPVYEGVTLTVVDHGPGHWPGSAMPGQIGNAVFAGHRVTHSHPFRRLHELVAGDEIIVSTNDGVFTYTMARQEIVKPTDTWIVNQTDDATITLFACHPPGSARQRIVVRGSFRASAPAERTF